LLQKLTPPSSDITVQQDSVLTHFYNVLIPAEPPLTG
jgi:hypothetical protein